MRFGKFRFNSIKEFLEIQKLAIQSGIKTINELETFLKNNCGDKLIKY